MSPPSNSLLLITTFVNVNNDTSQEGHLRLTSSHGSFPENSFLAVETGGRMGRVVIMGSYKD